MNIHRVMYLQDIVHTYMVECKYTRCYSNIEVAKHIYAWLYIHTCCANVHSMHMHNVMHASKMSRVMTSYIILLSYVGRL